MGNLIRLLKKYHLFLIFVILEALCISLFTSESNYALAKFSYSTNLTIGNLLQRRSNLEEYLSLKLINQELVQQNSILLKELETKTACPDSIKVKHPYASDYDTSYYYISAQVIDCPIYRSNNLITLNKGKLDGLEQDMGVVSSAGVVGIVISTSNHFALVRPIINQHGEMGISGKLKKNDAKGSVKWHDTDYRQAQFLDIGREEEVAIGDTVVTSGLSSSFPKNIPIGIVSSAECKTGNGFYDITLTLSVNFKNLMYVQVIGNKLNDERKILEASNQ